MIGMDKNDHFERQIRNIYIILMFIFVCLELVLFILFHFSEKVSEEVGGMCVVISALVFSILGFLLNVFVNSKKGAFKIKDIFLNGYIFFPLALLFTCLADYQLLAIDGMDMSLGLFFFSICQLAYAMYLFRKKEFKMIHFLIRVFASLVAVVISLLVLREDADLLSILTLFYFTNLLCNFAFSCFYKEVFLAIAFFLFILCDLSVGFSMLDLYIEGAWVTDYVNGLDVNLAWIFYIPSQTMLAMFIWLDKIKLKKDPELTKE